MRKIGDGVVGEECDEIYLTNSGLSNILTLDYKIKAMIEKSTSL